MALIRTGVSQAFWCSHRTDRGVDFEAARLSDSPRDALGGQRPAAWLDILLKGGIVLPGEDELSAGVPSSSTSLAVAKSALTTPSEGGKRAVTILLAGPPGGGKSTLAMEMAYRWATNTYGPGMTGAKLNARPMSTAYITSEANVHWLIEKANSYGWNADKFKPPEGVRGTHGGEFGFVKVERSADFRRLLEPKFEGPASIISILDALKRWLGSAPIDKVQGELTKMLRLQDALRHTEHRGLDALVIDSVGPHEHDQHDKVAENFLAIIERSAFKLVIVVLDAGRQQEISSFWENICDIVIRVGMREVQDYMIRTLEIRKTRYQEHVSGRQQLKIYARQDSPSQGRDASDLRITRQHPYRTEGGIFIYPSIHYHLSNSKRAAPQRNPSPCRTPFPQLNALLHGGLPSGRCTGFIGQRGGHKSHLGYVCILRHLLAPSWEATEDPASVPGEPEPAVERGDPLALIVSLRDDEELARGTLDKIRRQSLPAKGPSVDDLLHQGRLEILHYVPGYITPEEFYHRLTMSVERLQSRRNKGPIMLLFNSLDQLKSRFPLCAREDIFVPGIIETLSAHGITSIFIAVEGEGQPPEQFGLRAMADLILYFRNQDFAPKDYIDLLERTSRRRLAAGLRSQLESRLGPEHFTVSVSVERFAGGQAAGASGILELVGREHPAYEAYERLSEPPPGGGDDYSGLYFASPRALQKADMPAP